jgi:ribosomal protein L19
MKKTIKPKLKKVTKKKDDVLYIAGLITKGKDKGKYIALSVRNTMLLNPVEPAFETNPELEYVVVGKNEKILRKAFGRIVAMASQDKLITVKD